MEFHITIDLSQPDLNTIDEALRAIDPAALVDIEGGTLRVATSLRTEELVHTLDAAGYQVSTSQVMQLPSTCCGGCSG